MIDGKERRGRRVVCARFVVPRFEAFTPEAYYAKRFSNDTDNSRTIYYT